RHERVDASDQDAEDDRLNDVVHVDPLYRSAALAAPPRLWRERSRERNVLREDRTQLSVHPFDEQVTSLRLADRVPAQHALHRRPTAGMQGRDDLLVVDRMNLLRDVLHDLA